MFSEKALEVVAFLIALSFATALVSCNKAEDTLDTMVERWVEDRTLPEPFNTMDIRFPPANVYSACDTVAVETGGACFTSMDCQAPLGLHHNWSWGCGTQEGSGLQDSLVCMGCFDADGDYYCQGEMDCSDGIDDDCNGLTDGEDPFCRDEDQDRVADARDNCPHDYNPSQADGYGERRRGDVCEDTDGDLIMDVEDNCPLSSNSDQADLDTDGRGDVCDFCVAGDDADRDRVCSDVDNCPDVANTDQLDSDADGVGDACQ